MEDGAHLVELGLADAVDPLAHQRVRERPVAHAILELAVNEAVERAPPRMLRVLALGTRDQDDRGGELGAGSTELRVGDDGEERPTLHHAAVTVRHLEAEAGETALMLDHAADDPRIDHDMRHRERSVPRSCASTQRAVSSAPGPSKCSPSGRTGASWLVIRHEWPGPAQR